MAGKCCALLLAILFAFVPGAASAQSYPVKPIKLVVGFPPGPGVDLLARLMAQKLAKAWGQSVIVENKPGADAIIATDFVAKSAPDGYTLYVGASGAMAFNPGLYRKLSYDPVKDFVPIVQIASYPLVMAVHPSGQAKSLGQFIQLAKANPGKFNYSSGSSPFQVVTELFKKQAGIDIMHVPYKGSVQAILAALAGDTDLVTVDLPSALAQLRAGKLQGLAVSSPQRSSMVPNLPTMAESGLPNFNVVLWSGIFAPAGTPKEVVDKLHDAAAQILKMDDIRSRLTELGYEPGSLSQAQFAALLNADVGKWSKAARESNIRVE